MNALVYVTIDLGIHWVKMSSRKKSNSWVFLIFFSLGNELFLKSVFIQKSSEEKNQRNFSFKKLLLSIAAFLLSISMLKSYGSLDMQSLNCTLSVCTRVQYLNIDHLNKFCCIILITTTLLFLMKTRGYEMNTQKYMCYDIYLPRHYKDISLEKY